MRGHAHAQPLEWKLSDCGIRHQRLEPKWPTAPNPPKWTADTRAARSNSRDTVTNRCSMLWGLSRSISASHHFTCPPSDACAQTGLLLRAYARCDITADFGKGSPRRSIPPQLPLSLSYCLPGLVLYYLLTRAHSATVAVSEAGVPQCCRVYACFLGSSMSSELYMNSWIDACFKAQSVKTQTSLIPRLLDFGGSSKLKHIFS